MTIFTMEGARLKFLACQGCGCPHAIPAEKHETCVEEGGFWTCPNGCRRGYREGRKAREAVQRECDRLRRENARLEDEVRAAQEAKGKAVKKLKGYQRRAAAKPVVATKVEAMHERRKAKEKAEHK